MRPLISLAALILLACPAIAEDNPLSDVYACVDKADDMERLACYDAAVGVVKTAEEAGEITTVSRAQIEEVERDSFGFHIPSLPKLALPHFGSNENGDGDRPERIREVRSAITRIGTSATGKVEITLENGQVWRQTDSTFLVKARRNPEMATIKHGAFSSYRMQLDNGRWFKARRIK